MRIKIAARVLVSLLLFTFESSASQAEGTEWKKLDEEDQVIVYEREIPGSPVVAFRGSTTIDAPIAKIARVLDDSSRRKEWIAKVVDAYTIKQVSAMERWEYNHTEGNLLFQGRDFVFTATNELNRKTKEVWIKLKSGVLPELGPKDGVTRGELINSEYYLKVLEPSKTFVQVQIMADPKGNIPKWLVNLYQKDWPIKTLNGIRRQVKKPFVTDLEILNTYFNSTEGPDFLTKDNIKGTPFEKVGMAAKP